MKWKKITDCSKHEISEDGRVRNIISGKYLKNAIDRYGYEKIHLIKDDGSNYYTTIHRLVADAFVDGKFPGAHVNHMDGNKLNNHYTNLEWVTARENVIHSYDNLLNKNTNKVSLFNKITNVTTHYRSLKSLAKDLNIYISNLLPLIRFSDVNPILNKYTVRFINEEIITEPSNTKNFGKTIYVLDELTNEIKMYPSISIASYFTCVRSLDTHFNKKSMCSCIGYHFAYDITILQNLEITANDEIINIRKNYILTPYVKRDHKYYLYDYYTGIEKIFDSIDELVTYFNANIEYKSIDNNMVSQAIGHGQTTKRSGILRGYGIKSSRYDYDWFPYMEETIITNRNGHFAVPVFRVSIEEKTHYLIGKQELCKFMNYFPNKQLKDITIEEIVKFSNIPNISIVRLNKPIKIKMKI